MSLKPASGEAGLLPRVRCPATGTRLAFALAALLILAGGHGVSADDATTNAAAGRLRQKYAELAGRLDDSAFGKPLYLESTQASGQLNADVYALLAHPFRMVQAELKQPARWCDILILHPNTKFCRAAHTGAQTLLNVNIGRKSDQPIEQSYRVDFVYRVQQETADYLAVVLHADKGPVGTHDYRLLLEAVPLAGGQTFLHLGYSYGYGVTAKLALLAYLGTAGSGKVGFTVTGRRRDGQPVYVEGLRGVIERNTMRYYLAIEAYLDALDVPPSARLDKRLADWYVATERYARQLHEISRSQYLEMKHKEIERQQAAR
jgi:hypothetical protein